MDLSGKLIKGTGSYEVKEVAPPVESGQLLLNNNFENWTADDPDNWIVVAEDANNYVTERDGACRIVSDSSDNVRIVQTVCVVGKHYMIKISCIDVTSGTLDLNAGGLWNINSVGIHTFYFTATSVSIDIRRDFGGNIDVTIDWVEIEEVSEGYPLMDKGTKYLECTSPGTVAFPSTQSYGEWEFDFYKLTSSDWLVGFVVDRISSLNNTQGYWLHFRSTEAIRFLEATSSGNNILFGTVDSYANDLIWYRIKIIRTLDGKFSLYIKGGNFGIEDWALIDVSGGTGTNPITNTNYIIANYFNIDLEVGDRISNLVMRKAVRQ